MPVVNIQSEYMTLSQFLKRINAIDTGGQAKFFLREHTVRVNGEPEVRRGRKLRPGDKVEIFHQVYVIEASSGHAD
ncbi:S4 domain-containing protein YaaA [Alicyclobacillus herbarius]|uniref:S4 domain-containing protein YaaA n=1 Tax=Alicyclobacillus herbarius TaxID=122960 RepID=UPI0003F8F0FE|nr:S4 domain-containing protein YaaA [Alicyclobacillus herbarius]